MRTVVVDIETVDPYISRGLSAGWPYGVHVKDHDYKLLGCAFAIEGKSVYVTDHIKICNMLLKADVLVMHNASYDFGGFIYLAKSLGREDLLKHLRTVTVYDTMILAKLHDTSLKSFSLDGLCSKYFRSVKDNDALVNAAVEVDAFPWTKKDLTAKMRAMSEGKEYKREVDPKKVLKFCKENMDLLQELCPEVIAQYAKRDVQLTLKLFNYFEPLMYNPKAAKFYCEMIKVCAFIRLKGVLVDSDRIKEVQAEMEPLIESKLTEAFEIAGEEFNINSPKDVSRVFDQLKIKYGKTAAGNPSITTPWLAKQDHPMCKALVEARKHRKIKRDFIDKLEDIREYTDPGTCRYFRIYPHMQVMGAITGRFSCSGINIQQIPARDPKLGPLCRSVFVPEQGSKWYSLDYSNQEGRLQVHYAASHNCEGAKELVELFKRDPGFDMHQKIADLAGIERFQAKVINLGLSYGMGKAKLALSLGLTSTQASLLTERYHDAVPYLKQLNKITMEGLKKRKYITTIGKRRNHLDKPMIIDGDTVTFEYKALNKLIQGSAADQIMLALYLGHKAGLDIIFAVHDQICVAGTEEDAIMMQEIMENCVKLSLPMVVDVDLNGGENWASAGH